MDNRTEGALGAANDGAARATRAWLQGLGLAHEVEATRFAAAADPIPAPGLEHLVESLAQRCGVATNAADRVASLCDGSNGEFPLGQIDRTLAEVDEAASLTERLLRQIAQLTLGVTSHCDGTDAIYRLERAATMILHPRDAPAVELVDEGIAFAAVGPDDLQTELAGVLCRMIVDHSCELDLRTPQDRGVRFRVDTVGNLDAVCYGVRPDVDGDRLEELGWASAPDFGGYHAGWPDPATVAEPACLAALTLSRVLDMGSPAELTIRPGHRRGFEHACAYAARTHEGQVRKGTNTPYLSHMLAVSSLVLEAGGDEDEAIAALLHDTVEDHGAEHLADIQGLFGPRVCDIVARCTDATVFPKPPWLARKRNYVERIRRSLADPATDRGYLRVTLSDKLHNVRSILADASMHGDAVYGRFAKAGRSLAQRRARTLGYYGDLADAFARELPDGTSLGWHAVELRRVVHELSGKKSYTLDAKR